MKTSCSNLINIVKYAHLIGFYYLGMHYYIIYEGIVEFYSAERQGVAGQISLYRCTVP